MARTALEAGLGVGCITGTACAVNNQQELHQTRVMEHSLRLELESEKSKNKANPSQEDLNKKNELLKFVIESAGKPLNYLIRQHSNAIKNTSKIETEIQNLLKCINEYTTHNGDLTKLSSETCTKEKIDEDLKKIEEATKKNIAK